MAFPANLARVVVSGLAAVWLASACGGETFDQSVQSGVQSGADSGVVTTDSSAPDGAAVCIDFVVNAADHTCASDQDCTLVRSGEICSGQCSCGSTPINASGVARYESDIAPLALEACPCVFPGNARCLAGRCTLCGPGPDQPAGCVDAGNPPVDDSGSPGVDAGEEDSGVKTADSGTDTGTDGGACVDFVVTAADHVCAADQDCALIRSGEVCSGECSCGSTPVSAAAAARYASDVASLKLEACPCAFGGEARCIASRCTLCGLGPAGLAACSDDAGAASDGGTGAADGGTCVDIDLSMYDQSCTQTSDCILLLTGKVCTGDCTCGGSPVNASEQARFQEATSGIAFGECFCPAQPAPTCIANKCSVPVAMPLNQ